MCIVKSIVEAHEGTLSFLSKEKEGTCFTIALPLMN
jgi:signal transduction histidine kinase